MRSWMFSLLAALAAGLVCTAPAAAQDAAFAGKTVRIVVPGPPGGPGGVIAHLLANKASIHLGTTVIVEYKPGAGGNIAIEYVARSAPDGTTLFFGVPALVTNPYFQKHALDPGVLAPVIQLNRGAFLLLVNPKSDVKTVADLVAKIKAAPGQVGCNSGAVALSTVSCHLLQAYAGPMLMVAYQGNAQALAALERNEIASAFDFTSSSAGAVKEGRLRAIAITSKERNTGDFKDVPPIAETIPGFDLVGWQGIMVTRDTPRDLVLKLNAAFNKVLAEDEVKAFLRKGNLEVAGGTPEDFAAKIKHDTAFYGRVAKEAKIEPQ
ncbi:MAG TPA: tripartite tricarboxylate transporter substrate binding protein [Xanthobacteraceae bacterium]|nr:tripartite tricarboxylate transporter substrate binding protein [Xanthobacteraceae bacterium]